MEHRTMSKRIRQSVSHGERTNIFSRFIILTKENMVNNNNFDLCNERVK